MYLSAIAVALGDEVPLADLPDEVVRRELTALRGEGLAYCRVSDRPVPDLAADAAGQTLDQAAGRSVDNIIYCTDTPPEVTATSDAWDLQVALGLSRTPVTVVGGAGCGNLGVGLRTARNLIRAEGLSTVLVVTADRVRQGTRYLANGRTVLSDGAASCLVTAEPPGPAGSGQGVGRVAGLAMAYRADIGRTAQRPIVVAKATAERIMTTTRLALAPLSRKPADVRHLVSGNYGRSAQLFLASHAGVPAERVCSPLRERIGHCFAADALLGLASLLRDGMPAAGEPVLLLTMSPRSWSAIAVTGV